jgi:glycosyltransferase involved in cell wall biosynthesis
VRVLIWHGWLLEGSGSNIAAARITESLRRSGHDVLLLCQATLESAPDFIDAVGTVGDGGSPALTPNDRAEPDPSGGRAAMLRPDIGSLLPVFVVDEYEGFTVKRFVDLTQRELHDYLGRNVAALRGAAAWHRPDVVIASHVVPGGVIAARSFPDTPFVVHVHGSDIEYAVRLQDRYAELAREAMERSTRVAGGSRDVLQRAEAFAPSVSGRAVVIPPGVEVQRFRPMPRRPALEEVAALLEGDAETDARALLGRPDEMTDRLASVIGTDPDGPDRLAREYDQDAPDIAAASRLRALARIDAPTVAYLGKLIPQKGVELFVQALALLPAEVQGLVIGFGGHREWLEALVTAVDAGGRDLEWIRAHSGLQIEIAPEALAGGRKLGGRITFTGRLDHRYAPMALAAADVLVVPSVIPEAFAMVAAEGAAAGSLPLVARHSGLAEVAETLETHVGRPGLFGFQPGEGATRRIADGIQCLLSLPSDERDEMRRAASAFARATWTWDRTAAKLVAAGRP